MATEINVSGLAVDLQEKTLDYRKIFGLHLANGFAAKNDMVSLQIEQKVRLKRLSMGNMTQPGRKPGFNPIKGDALTFKGKEVELRPAKADILLTEDQIYNLNISFLSEFQPADETDIHSVAGRDFLMSKIFEQLMFEQNRATFLGQLGFGYDDTNDETKSESVYQGGLNLFDGLELQFTQGYATSGPGAVGDIPGDNKVVGAAATLTADNVLSQLEKFEEIIHDVEAFEEFAYEDERTPDGVIWMSHKYLRLLARALDNLPYKQDNLVEREGDHYRFKALPKVKIKKARWMSGADNFFFSPTDNLFYLTQKVAKNIPKMDIQKENRDLKILIDWEAMVTYASGTHIILWK